MGERWAVYYDDKLAADQFDAFDVLVFDREHHPPLAPLHDKILLGYISLGEAETYRSDFAALKAKHIFLSSNPQWKGHVIIDIRKPEWKSYVLDVLIPATLAEGFNGVMFDTLDSPVALETKDPVKYSGMQAAAIELLRDVRARYPDIKIMVNRGLEILPQAAPSIDMVMAETIYTDWQPGEKAPVVQPEEAYTTSVEVLKAARSAAPALKVYTLDYWPSSDENGLRKIYTRQRGEGFVPYVAPTLGLEQLGSDRL